MYITQTYNDSYSHSANVTGNPKDFPIDESCGSDARDYFYCPCDEMVVKRIYGVGNSGTNTIWLESTTKVLLANGTESYVTIMVIHPNDDTLKNIKVGNKFKRKEPMFVEGNDGNATGNHFHISVSASKYVSGGWILNDKGAWVIKGSSIKPENAFFIDEEFTEIVNTRNLNFKKLPKILGNPVIRDEKIEQIEVIIDNLYIRERPNEKILGYANKGLYNVLEEQELAGYRWYRIEEGMWIASNEGVWTKYYGVVIEDDVSEDEIVDDEVVNDIEEVKEPNIFIRILNWFLKILGLKR